jgi:hypothetical protein
MGESEHEESARQQGATTASVWLLVAACARERGDAGGRGAKGTQGLRRSPFIGGARNPGMARTPGSLVAADVRFLDSG